MRAVVAATAVALMVSAGCASGSGATPITGTVPPYSAEPLPTATPTPAQTPPPTPVALPPTTAPSETTRQPTTAPPTTAPVPPSVLPSTAPTIDGSALTVPAVSIAGDVVSPEQQDIVDVAVRSWRLYWRGIQNPNDPTLDADLQTVYVDGALDGNREFFRQLRENGQYVTSSDDTPPVFSPIVGSIAIDGDAATMLTCQVAPGELVAPGPDGKPVGMGRRIMIFRTTYEFRRVDATWFVSRLVGEGANVEGTSCEGHLQY